RCGKGYTSVPERGYPSSDLSNTWSQNLIFLARRFLFKSGHRGSLRERRLDILQLDAARLQQHQQMVDKVGTFSDEMASIVRDRGDDGLHRFLAKLFGAMLGALVEQLLGVGRLPARCGAGIDGGGQIVNGKTRH